MRSLSNKKEKKKKKKKRKGNIVFFAELWALPWSGKQSSQRFRVGSRLVSSVAQRANCAQQHHSVTRRLTNALAIVAFDGDAKHASRTPRRRLVTHLTPFVMRLWETLSWLLARSDGGRRHGWFTCCFDPRCQSPVSSHRHSWLGWSR